MIDIQAWLTEYQKKVLEVFKQRVCFIGIQGSYARGEAHESSDIDVVLILDHLAFEDLKKYKEMIDTLEHRELICGFISGKAELMQWHKADLFQFYHDTLPLYRDLSFIANCFSDEDIREAMLIGACNLYHGCVHNYLHEQSSEVLKALKKSAVFVLQAKYFLEHHQFVSTHKELAKLLEERDQEIMEMDITKLEESEKMIRWASSLMDSLS